MLVLFENLLRELLFLGIGEDWSSIFTCTCSSFFILDEFIVVPVFFDVFVLKAVVGREGLDVYVGLLDLEGVVVDTDEDVEDENGEQGEGEN